MLKNFCQKVGNYIYIDRACFLEKLAILKEINENFHVTPEAGGGSKPVWPNDTWGRSKIGQKVSCVIWMAPLDHHLFTTATGLLQWWIIYFQNKKIS